MRKITAKVISASDISGDPSDTARIILIPSGFRSQWIVVVEDIDYHVSAEYMKPEDRFLLEYNREN